MAQNNFQEENQSNNFEFDFNSLGKIELHENNFQNENVEDNANINISYNELDLNEIYDSKEIKNKILYLELLNFIEVFIHSVLYFRKVYPEEAFHNYIIYNLNLKFIIEPEINEHIGEFLNNIELLMFNNLIKSVTINIIEPEKKKILEYFSLNVEINEYYNDLIYSDICLHLKSLLYKFQIEYANKQELFPDLNKSFNLCIETCDSKIFSASNFKTFKEINNTIEDNFVIDLFNDTSLKLISNREVCTVLDHVNFHITISRCYL